MRFSILNRPLPVFAPPDAPAATPPAATPPAATPPAATPPAATPPPSSIAAPPGPGPSPGPATFPDNWRDLLAGDNKDLRKDLDRYDNPGAVAKANLEAKQRIRSGKSIDDVPMPDPATDADGAKKWREDRGLPPDPTGYKLPDELTARLQDGDKPILAGYLKTAHEKNLPPAVVQANVEWYADLVETQAAEQAGLDKDAGRDTEDKLREVWGKDYRPMKEAVNKYATELTPGIDWFNARMDDGRRLGDSPAVVQAIAKLMLLEHGDLTLVGGDALKGAQTRIAELKASMQANGGEFKTPAEQKEYYDLLAAQEKSPKKGG